MTRANVIFHLDMNSFYASVEMAHDPRLKGKPIAIAGNVEERRGIIVTSSYEARAKGVKTTMQVWQAKRLCPNIEILSPNFERYRKASQELFALLRSYTSLVEPISIDEGFVDATFYLEQGGHPLKLAREIQTRIKNEMDLPCSIGIAPNKFLAKMASDMKKPNGITVLRKRDLPSKLWPLPIQEMYGVGRRTVEQWRRHKINTIGDLAQADPSFVKQHFGIHGVKLYERANGQDDRIVDPESINEFKSIGHSTTLRSDTRNRDIIQSTFYQLAESVERRLHRKKVYALGIQIMIRYHDWKTITRSRKVANPVRSKQDIWLEATQLFEKAWSGEAVRLLGISTYELLEEKYAYKQLDLFNYKQDEKKEKLSQTVSELQARFGEHLLTKGRELSKNTEFETKESKQKGTSFQKDFLDRDEDGKNG